MMMVAGLIAIAQDDVVRNDTLEGVTITSRSAQKRVEEVQIGVEKVEIATLAKVPALFGEKDIIKSIQLLPGVKSESEASGGYQVRGGTAAQNLILLDGATVYNAGHLMGLFSTFNDDALMGASLYKGLVPAWRHLVGVRHPDAFRRHERLSFQRHHRPTLRQGDGRGSHSERAQFLSLRR